MTKYVGFILVFFSLLSIHFENTQSFILRKALNKQLISGIAEHEHYALLIRHLQALHDKVSDIDGNNLIDTPQPIVVCGALTGEISYLLILI